MKAIGSVNNYVYYTSILQKKSSFLKDYYMLET